MALEGDRTAHTGVSLPRPVGDHVYHSLQQIKGLKPNVSRHTRFVDRIRQVCRVLGRRSFGSARIVELGSGWFPIGPLLFCCEGADEVHTYDLNEHYSRGRTRLAAVVLQAKMPACEVLKGVSDSGELPPEIRYSPKTDLAAVHLREESIDLAVSQYVLEHVTPGDLERIHLASRDWMVEDGLWIHWISPGDHRSYSDSTLAYVDFLRYSEEEWSRLCGNRFAYHNRLRRSQYRQLFERCGWRIAFEDADVNAGHLKQLESIPLHPDYEGMSPEDLVAGSLVFALQKS